MGGIWTPSAYYNIDRGSFLWMGSEEYEWLVEKLDGVADLGEGRDVEYERYDIFF